jgi:hypothetical protein
MNVPQELRANITNEEFIRLISEANQLRTALESATAYVELFTGKGVTKQPDPRYIKSDGDYDVEAIARDARAALRRSRQ